MNTTPPDLSDAKMAELASSLRTMIASESWKFYISVMQDQVAVRDSLLDEPLQFHDQVLNQEFMKGVRKGLKTAMDLPAQMLEDFQVRLDQLKESNDENE